MLSPRLAFLLRRLGRLAVSLAVVVVATFLIVHLVPGDPVRAALGPSATPELVAATRAELGLDQPLLQQFTDYVAGLLRGDFGVSIRTQRPVGETIAQRFPSTLTLAVLAFVVTVVGALPIGVAAAISARSGRHGVVDGVVSSVLGMLIAIPSFLLAVGMIAVFSVSLGLLPVAGWGDPQHLVLPVLTLALGPMAYLARIVQVEMFTVLDSTYMTTARSKRLPARLVYLRHALPNIVTASLTVGGLILSGLTAATVLVEMVFAIPGLGEVTVAAVGGKDYPMIQGVVLVYALTVLGVNLVVDLILITVDPRSSIAEG
ncbi:ABC transporter permease [Jiangella alkaliphila]|uniref:Peptide/nickel transport system permease protein n=1 Tax=Jiangella alkaliphila TaxID=419479 RepID=A0A1H2KJZ3_9ACTN|nr:ABC transporter permease [Jiangella alkaliphila]SDU68902.1 peptide/nickel transport system permease protein [Jiangella alkaliphila]